MAYKSQWNLKEVKQCGFDDKKSKKKVVPHKINKFIRICRKCHKSM